MTSCASAGVGIADLSSRLNSLARGLTRELKKRQGREMTAVHNVDFSPLTRTVDSCAVADLRRDSIAQKVQPAAFDDVFFFWMMLVTLLVLLGMLLLVDLGHISILVKVPFTVLMGPLVAISFGLIFNAIYRLRVRFSSQVAAVLTRRRRGSRVRVPVARSC